MNLTTGFYPFWFWNDKLCEQEIEYQIKEMAAQGIKGFYIHPRQGLQQPYLSESFFAMVDKAVEVAEKYGLKVHFYDEYPYPSGIAGGEVVLGNPQFQATRLIQEEEITTGGKIRLQLPSGKILAVKAYPLHDDTVDWEQEIDLKEHVGLVLIEDSYVETGLTSHNRKRYFASKPTPVLKAELPLQQYKVFISVQVEVEKFKYWDHYVDTLNQEAMQKFINLTHERYRKRYENKFGDTIISIFTDEVKPGWSERIPPAFKKEYGYDLCQYLPVLQDSSHPQHHQVKYDLQQLQFKMFCQSFEFPVSNWCRKYNLAYAGEKPSWRLSQLKYMDIPGCDPGHTKAGEKTDMLEARIRGNARAVASAAYFYDAEGALCECYHSMGWSGTIQDAKVIAEGLLLHGIKYLVPHGFFYSTHALKKHDAPPSFFFQMPYWHLFGKLSERIEKISEQLAGTYIDAQALLLDPHAGIPDNKDLETYSKMQSLLIENHIDFQIVDTDILANGHIKDGYLEVKDLEVKLVIIPPMQVIEQPLQDWIDTFEDAGGQVICCNHDFETDELLNEIVAIAEPELRIECNGEEVDRIWAVKRKSDNRTFWFILNTSSRKYDAEIKAENIKLKEVLLSDKIIPLIEKDDGVYRKTIYPFESFMVEAYMEAFKDEDSGDNDKDNKTIDTEFNSEPTPYPHIKVPVAGKTVLQVKDKNLLRMYNWQMSLLDDSGKSLATAEVPAVPVGNQLEKGCFHFKPEIKHYFGHKPQLVFPELNVNYQYSFNNEYTGPVELVLEPGSIAGDWKIIINDNQNREIKPDDFTETTAHVRGSLGYDITDLLQKGTNKIRIDVKTEKTSYGLINALYLAGDFGVKLDPVTLVAPKQTGVFENYRENLLPYFSGELEYITEFTLDTAPETDEVVLDFQYDNSFHKATEVSVNGSQYQPVLWEPRLLKISSSVLKEGINTVKTRVYTSLIRSFEGKEFDCDNYTYKEV